MKILHKLHTAYNAFFYRIGFSIGRALSLFVPPLMLSLGIALISMCFVFVPFARAYGIGIICSCVALTLGIRSIIRVLYSNSRRISTLLFLQAKVLVIAVIFVLCYSIFQLSIFALLFGFITPLCILTIHVCAIYVFNTFRIKEL